ncbi:MAG: SDR family oxidoreductase [Myxococcota bacterium]|nr:SDR family oxidoreductase [Myxococcota bacterium]
MDLQLDDATVLITGASGGIGRALAAVFAAEGAQLVLHAYTGIDALRQHVADATWRDRVLCVEGDIRDPSSVDQMFSMGATRFGRIDVAIANAGIWPPSAGALDTLHVDRIRDTVAVNLLGAAWTARAWMAGLRAVGPRADGRGAALVLIGSTAGRFGEAGHADYAMTKAGLHGLMRSIKNEVVQIDPYARVNTVEPGWTITPMAAAALDGAGTVSEITQTMALRQLARPIDIARACAVLASPAASRHVTGEVLTIAGGMEGRHLWRPDEVDEEAVRARLADS